MTVISAKLYSDNIVKIDVRSLNVGGSWLTEVREGKGQAYDQQMIELVANRLSKKSCPYMIDIGANTGSFSLLPKFVDCSVLAIEPQSNIKQLLERNIQLNQLQEHVKTLNYALGDHHSSGKTTLNVPKENSGLGSLGKIITEDEVSSVEVVCSTLDKVAEEFINTKIDFIKLDTEGNELPILRGGEKTILKDRPEILVEFSKTFQLGYHPIELYRFVKSLNYKVIIINTEDMLCIPNGHNIDLDIKFFIKSKFKVFKLSLSYFIWKWKMQNSYD